MTMCAAAQTALLVWRTLDVQEGEVERERPGYYRSSRKDCIVTLDQKKIVEAIENRPESLSYSREANTLLPSLISRKTSSRDGDHDSKGAFDTPRVIELGNVTERHYYNGKGF
ncbi:MAG: hypothetical protein ACYC1A_08855 [Spirochaetales bacterium]